MNLSPLEWAMALIIVALIVLLVDTDRSRWAAIDEAEAAKKRAAQAAADHAALRARYIAETQGRHHQIVIDENGPFVLYEN